MAFIPVPDTASVELIYTYQGSIMENVLYYSGLNVSDAGVLQGLAENAFLMWQNTWQAYQNNALYVSWVKATDLTADNGSTYTYIPTGGNAGDRPDQGLPANCAVLLSMQTTHRGKSYRGRLYVPGLTEDQCDGSTIASACRTAFTGYFADWDFLDVDGEPYGLQVVSRYHNGAPRVNGIHTDVTGWVCRPYIASQRRRLPGRGS